MDYERRLDEVNSEKFAVIKAPEKKKKHGTIGRGTDSEVLGSNSASHA